MLHKKDPGAGPGLWWLGGPGTGMGKSCRYLMVLNVLRTAGTLPEPQICPWEKSCRAPTQALPGFHHPNVAKYVPPVPNRTTNHSTPVPVFSGIMTLCILGRLGKAVHPGSQQAPLFPDSHKYPEVFRASLSDGGCHRTPDSRVL
jgi:hypothetical protein